MKHNMIDLFHLDLRHLDDRSYGFAHVVEVPRLTGEPPCVAWVGLVRCTPEVRRIGRERQCLLDPADGLLIVCWPQEHCCSACACGVLQRVPWLTLGCICADGEAVGHLSASDKTIDDLHARGSCFAREL